MVYDNEGSFAPSRHHHYAVDTTQPSHLLERETEKKEGGVRIEALLTVYSIW